MTVDRDVSIHVFVVEERVVAMGTDRDLSILVFGTDVGRFEGRDKGDD
jgi:hypothetical protein